MFYFPIEELLLALNPLNFYELFSAPILSLNMTSGLILSNIYNLTFSQLLLTLALGIAISANLFIYMDLRQRKCANSPTTAAFAAGGGVLATHIHGAARFTSEEPSALLAAVINAAEGGMRTTRRNTWLVYSF